MSYWFKVYVAEFYVVFNIKLFGESKFIYNKIFLCASISPIWILSVSDVGTKSLSRAKTNVNLYTTSYGFCNLKRFQVVGNCRSNDPFLLLAAKTSLLEGVGSFVTVFPLILTKVATE